MSNSLDGKAETLFISGSTAHRTWSAEYLCPTHGVTKDGCVSFWENGKPAGNYCMECYKDMVRKFCQPVTRV